MLWAWSVIPDAFEAHARLGYPKEFAYLVNDLRADSLLCDDRPKLCQLDFSTHAARRVVNTLVGYVLGVESLQFA